MDDLAERVLEVLRDRDEPVTSRALQRRFGLTPHELAGVTRVLLARDLVDVERTRFGCTTTTRYRATAATAPPPASSSPTETPRCDDA